ncbi:hypothetical protein [Algoriphagus antarcticus]|uniref:Uncharacterized protein n=1 Tax=Algoriphagus antarcticus TaxID=238540 RepID=A0A3E0DZC3_9BACT|nr:hypothetical protein [Algoriphagus antarcticus]REG90710.1 hypothetical protein C8N25_106213 [Algoriphagus antarcticus]
MKNELNKKVSAINAIKLANTLSDQMVVKINIKLSELKRKLNHSVEPNYESLSLEIDEWAQEIPIASKLEIDRLMQQ